MWWSSCSLAQGNIQIIYIYETLKPYMSISLGKDRTMLSVGQYLGLSLMLDLILLI